jgi:hypothetical protein
MEADQDQVPNRRHGRYTLATGSRRMLRWGSSREMN